MKWHETEKAKQYYKNYKAAHKEDSKINFSKHYDKHHEEILAEKKAKWKNDIEYRKRSYGVAVRAHRRRMVKLKLEHGGKCKICGYDKNFASLVFHHVRGEKKFTINTSAKSHRIALIKEEIKKCDLVCRNCHMELHHPQLDKSQLQEIMRDRRIDKD